MATINGAVVSIGGTLTSLRINENLTIDGDAYSTIKSGVAAGVGTVGIAAGTYSERITYGNSANTLQLYGVEGTVVGNTTYVATGNTNGQGGAFLFIAAGSTLTTLISGQTVTNCYVDVSGLTASEKVGGGAVIHHGTDGGLAIENTLFYGNTSGAMAGAVYFRIGSKGMSVADTVFDRNFAALNGGAMRTNGGGDISGVTFSTNTAGGNGGAIAITTTAAQETGIFNTLFTGNKADGNGGAIYISPSSGGTVPIYLGGLTFHGNSAASGGALYMTTGYANVHISGLLTLETADDTICVDGGTLTVDAADFLTGGSVYAKVIDTKFSENYLVKGSIGTGENYQLFNSRNDLYVAPDSVTFNASTAYVDAAAADELIVTGQTSINPLYSDAGEAMASGSNHLVFRPGAYSTASRLSISGMTIAGETTGAVFGGVGMSVSDVKISGMTFSGNSVADTSGGAIYVTGGINRISDSFFSGNTVVSTDGTTRYYGGAVCINGGTTTIEDVTFTGNVVQNPCRGSSLYANSGTLILNRIHSLGNEGYSLWFESPAAVTLQDSVIEDNITARSALTIEGDVRISGNIAYNSGSITVNGNLIFDAGLTWSHNVHTLAFGANGKLVFSNETPVTFTNKSGEGMNLGNAAIILDNAAYIGGTVVVATGIGNLGTVNFGEYADRFSYTFTDGTLAYSAVADIADGVRDTYLTGATYNLMTGGTVTGAFFGTSNASGDVTTTISGGAVGNAVIGGAKVTKGNTAALDTVTLNIAGGEIIGGTANKGMLYTAGYAYGLTGGTTTDVDPTLTVGRSALNLSGGSIAAQNLYSGAHARSGAYTVVDETVITVTDGTFGRIYGGGWAEKYGVSEVGSSSITVSGGYVEYIYAGGANAADGKTYVNGDVDIQFTGGTVDFVFLAGKNKDCWVGTDENDIASLTVSGDAKSMTRISGRNACGAGDRMLGTSVLNLETNLTVGYLDYVDEINIKEGNLLAVDTLFHSESVSALTVNFVLDGALDEDWDVIGGNAAYEYIQNMTTFEIGGVEYIRSADGKLGDSGYYLLDDTSNRKFVFSSSSSTLAQG